MLKWPVLLLYKIKKDGGDEMVVDVPTEDNKQLDMDGLQGITSIQKTVEKWLPRPAMFIAGRIT